jgi:predicted RNA-binding Zn ribbon-like protein
VERKGIANLNLVGGYLCLDFANTVHNRRGNEPIVDELQTYADLVAWSRKAGVLRDVDAERLLAEAGSHPRAAAAALERARSVRDGIYDVFSAVATDRGPRVGDLANLSRAWADVVASGRLTPMAGGFSWEWALSRGPLDAMLGPITRSAVDLLTSRESQRVRLCAAGDCSWLFIDRSKNKSRRWCEMESCGNRAKARRHHHRATGRS